MTDLRTRLCSTIAGKKILNEYIALGVYGMTGLGAWAAMRGGNDKKAAPVEISAKANSTSYVSLLSFTLSLFRNLLMGGECWF